MYAGTNKIQPLHKVFNASIEIFLYIVYNVYRDILYNYYYCSISVLILKLKYLDRYLIDLIHTEYIE